MSLACFRKKNKVRLDREKVYVNKVKEGGRGQIVQASIKGLDFILDVLGSYWKALSRALYEEQTTVEHRGHWRCRHPLDSFYQASAPKL